MIEARLGELCEVVRGASPRPKGDPRFFGGKIPWVLISDVTRASGKYLMRTKESVTDEGKAHSRFVSPGQLIVTNSATVGLPIFMGVGGCIHDGFLTFMDVDERLTLDWLYWYFHFARNQLELMAPEGTQKNLNTEIVENLRIPLPSIEDQNKISLLLNRSDRLHRLYDNARQLSDSFLQSFFLEMFDAKFRNYKGSKVLGDVVQITGGGTPSREIPEYFSGSIPWLTSKDMRGEYIFDTEEHITEDAIKNSATKIVPKNSVLVVVKSKVLMHRLPLAISSVDLCHGQDIKSIQCGDGIVHEFLRFTLSFYEERLLRIARGANTEGLTLPMLEELPIPNIEIEDQRKFASIVNQFRRLQIQQDEAERQAAHLFQTLLHSAFN